MALFDIEKLFYSITFTS